MLFRSELFLQQLHGVVGQVHLFIAVTGSDELNLLCCMFAKKAGHSHAIARVRNPSYSHELDFIKKQIGISAIINPEMAAAKEISHLLRFPGASKIDTFAGGRVRLIKFALTERQGLDGVKLEFEIGRASCRERVSSPV